MDQGMELVFAVFAKHFEMEEETKQLLELHTEEAIFKKGEVIVKQGRPSPYVYFNVQGLVQIFTEMGEIKIVTWLLKELDFMMSIDAFFEQEPAKDTMQAIERTVVKRISYHHLMEICQADPEFEKVVGKLVRKYYARNHERDKMLGLPDLDKYLCLLEKDPELLTRVPVEILCNYLRMTQGRFFAIRKELRMAKRINGNSGK